MLCRGVKERTPSASYLCWRACYVRFQYSLKKKTILFSPNETRLLRSTYARSTSRKQLWDNMQVCISYLDKLHASTSAASLQQSISPVTDKAKTMRVYLLFLTNINPKPASSSSSVSSASVSALGLSSQASNKRLREPGAEGGEEGDERDRSRCRGGGGGGDVMAAGPGNVSLPASVTSTAAATAAAPVTGGGSGSTAIRIMVSEWQ